MGGYRVLKPSLVQPLRVFVKVGENFIRHWKQDKG